MNEPTQEPTEASVPLPEAQNEPYTQPRDEPGGPMIRGAPEPAGRGGAYSREPLTRTERLLVTMFVTMFATMLGAGALGFTTLSGQLLDMQEQISGVQEQIGGVEKDIGGQLLDMQEQIGGVQKEIGGQLLDMQKHLGGQILGLQKQIGDLRTEMHDEIGELSQRMTGVETLIQTHLVPQATVRPPAGS